MDAVIATAVFIIALIFFLAVTFDETEQRRIDNLNQDLRVLVESIDTSRNVTGDRLVTGARLNKETLDFISTLSYEQLKNLFGITSDFCIHLEDENGNLVNISGRKTGLGSGLVRVGGVACNATAT